jgi:DNA-binding NarL/FixJ family response regulator
VRTVNYCSTVDDAILRLLELQPDLLILDHLLQKKNGTEVLRKLPQYSPHTHVCIFSSFLGDIDRSAFQRKEVRGFYDKSADLEGLLAHIENFASQSATANRFDVLSIN